MANQADIDTDTMQSAIQVGALCYRVCDGIPQVLLVTSRSTRRWIIPKGWPIKGETFESAAAIEAWEEAGVRGKIGKRSVGTYGYVKVAEKPGEADRHCLVSVFPLQVKSLAKLYPEQKDRQRRWFPAQEAARRVIEPELQQMLAGFQPGVP